MKKSIFEAVIIFVVFLLLMHFFQKNNDNSDSFASQPWFYALVGAIAAVVVDWILDRWMSRESFQSTKLAQLLR